MEVPSQSGEVVAAALPSISTDVDSSLPQPASTQSTTSVSAPPSTAVPSESKVTDEPLPLPSPVSSSQTTLGDVLPVLPRSPASPTKITEVPSPPQSPLPVRPAPFLATASDVPPASPTTSATVSPSKATNVILPLLSQAVAPSSLSGPGTKTSSTPTHVLSAAQDTASTVNTTTGDYQKSSVVPLAPTVVEFHEESTSTLLKKSDKQQGDQALSVSDPKLVSDDEWIKCVGQLEVITNQSKNLINTVKSDCVIGNVEEFLTSVVSSSKEIKFLCGKLELKSQNLLSQVLEEAANREDYLTDVLQSDDQVPQDPGSRPVVLTDKQRMYLVKLGPYQPKLSSFPKNEAMKKVKDTCCFSSRWYGEYPYLEYSIVTDRAYCFVCKLFSHGFDREKSERVWIEGFCDWWKAKGSRGKGKPGKIQLHFQSNSHKAALFDYATFCTESERVDLLLDKSKRTRLIEEEKILQQHRNVIAMMIDICRTLARQGLAFRNEPEMDSNFEQIVHLISRHNTAMKAWLTERNSRPYHTTYMSKNCLDEYITLLGETVQNNIVKEINDAGIIGIIADTTPDITHVDQLTVAVRFVDANDMPKERLLTTAEVKDKTGEGMAKAILKALSESKVDTDSIRFQTYDSAATMSGKYNGAQKKLSSILDRPITYIPCLPHGSNLVIEHGCNASKLVTYMYDALEACYVFFSSSTSRHAALKEKLEITEGAMQLRNLSKTRWSARPEAVEAFWRSYEEICEVLDEMTNATKKYDSETRTKAHGLYIKIKSFDFIIVLMFMKNVMYKTKHMVDVLQTEELDVSGALISMESTLKILQSMRSNAEEQKHFVEAALNFARGVDVDGHEEFKRVHRRRKLPKKLDDNPASSAEFTLYSYYNKEMNAVLDVMISVLDSKCENLRSSFKPFSEILDPNVNEYDTESFAAALQNLSETYPSEIPDTKSLTLELEVFNIHFSKHVEQHPEVQKTIRSAAQFALSSQRKHKLFPLLSKVFRLFLTAPPSVCKSERSFSRLKLLKTYLRNRIKEKKLHYLMLLSCESDLTDQLDLQEIVDRWKGMKTRRIKI